MKTAQVHAQTVSVACPECGEERPAPDNGSLAWEAYQLEKYAGQWTCDGCGKAYRIVAVKRVPLNA